MDTYRQSSHSPFRSRRSHPALNHISLAPLTPRFPIDDLPEQVDYFQSSHGQQSTSYLSSSSVPSTPPILTHSRASSRSRHPKRNKISAHALSDTDLQSLGARKAAALHQPQISTYLSNNGSKKGPQTPRKAQDTEWLLRAGLALTSSTREEKGQSWLVKRESSTSLVAEAEPDVIRMTRHHNNRQGKNTPFRSSRSSAISTPAALSRRGSRSREHSRRASRADFAMTALGAAGGGVMSGHSRKSSAGSYRSALPDFVDERIRAEIASMHGRDVYDEDDYDVDRDDISGSSSYGSESETDGDMDEKEFQRLTRERGFGLGSWVDQFVSWTLFGVEEDLLTTPHAPTDGSDYHSTVAFASTTVSPASPEESIDNLEEDYGDGDLHESTDATKSVERAGEKGGWADASWFFRLAKKSII